MPIGTPQLMKDLRKLNLKLIIFYTLQEFLSFSIEIRKFRI